MKQPLETTQEPPKSLLATLKQLGPGIIIAGSIVGSGELIATTLVGAKSSFTLMWLIIIGCMIKVFTQVEFGRHAIVHKKTPLNALNDLPGPRFKVNWIMWYWLIMMALVISQQGGILGAIGQALTMMHPLTEQGADFNRLNTESIQTQIHAALEGSAKEINAVATDSPKDVQLWAMIIAIITSIMLFIGRFNMIQWFSTILVFSFTVITFINVALLQMDPKWAMSMSDLATGLSFSLPKTNEGLATALAAFGLIGVGAAELIMYPYWCLEKGYAKFVGPNDQSPEWLARVKGWTKVMNFDAWASMFVYTFSTIAFYILGAAVLGKSKLMPADSNLIATLAEMYVPVFGAWAKPLFIFGAISVLYSTYFVAAAGNARVLSDGLGLFGILKNDETSRAIWAQRICGVWPLAALAMFLFFNSPKAMILWAGLSQAFMLPMLAFAALYYRYKRTQKELQPGRVWDVFLGISALGMLTIGIWTLTSKWETILQTFGF